MSFKYGLLNFLAKLPLIGGLAGNALLRSQHPVEWALLHRSHHTDNTCASILHFSVNKSATQYVKSILERIGAENGMTPVNLHGYAFNSKMPFFDHLNAEEMRQYAHLFHPRGYVYSVFGGAIEGISSMETYRTVLMVRDPRDVLTSMYYSLAYSHVVPEATGNKREPFLQKRAQVRQMSIDEFVLDAAERERSIYQRYTDLLVSRYPNALLTRYEEMTSNFDSWLDELLTYCQLEISAALRQEIKAEAEKMRPKTENIHAHVRKGQPGDYLEKLQPQTIVRLNEIFSQVLRDYRYA